MTPINEFGKVNGPWRSRSFLGYFFLVGSTQKICFSEGIEDLIRRTIFSWCAIPKLMRTEGIFFSYNFSVRVWNYLQIDWSHGLNTRQSILAASKGLGHPFFLGLFLLLHVIYGSCAMGKLSREGDPLLPLGIVKIYMIFLFLLIKWRLVTNQNYMPGSIAFLCCR